MLVQAKNIKSKKFRETQTDRNAKYNTQKVKGRGRGRERDFWMKNLLRKR